MSLSSFVYHVFSVRCVAKSLPMTDWTDVFFYTVVLRLLHIADVPGMTAGAAKEELLTIPVFKYQPSGIQTTTADSALPDTPNAPKTSSSSSASSSSWSRHFLSRFKRDKNDIESESYTTITIPSSDDAVCSICLSEYEKDDLICKLW